MLQLDHQKLKETISFIPTAAQQHILENLKTTTVICAGRRVGKSHLAAYIALKELLQTDRKIWVCGPSYNVSKIIWNYITSWAIRYFPTLLKVNKFDMSITNLRQNSSLELKSAETTHNLKGQGLSLLVITESGDIQEEVWEKYLRPNTIELRPELGNKPGRVFIEGNPSSVGHWFDRLFKTEQMADKFAYHLPTPIMSDQGEIIGSNNPNIVTVDALKEIKASTPEMVWKQQWLAMFIAGDGLVFRNVRDNIKNTLSPPLPDRKYVLGVDLAKTVDYSVITVIDRDTFELVDFQRFKDLDWSFQRKKIVETAKRYNSARIIIDASNIGDVIVEELRKTNFYVEPYKFTWETKRNLIEKLSIYIEQGRLKYPAIPELINELESFAYKVTPGQRVVYAAPTGLHDDIVISLALAVDHLDAEPKRMIKKPDEPSLVRGIKTLLNTKELATVKMDKSSQYL